MPENGTQQMQNEWLERIEKKLDRVIVDVAALKVKAGAWGALGGILAAIAVILLDFIRGK